jgi:hypothetical protein
MVKEQAIDRVSWSNSGVTGDKLAKHGLLSFHYVS